MTVTTAEPVRTMPDTLGRAFAVLRIFFGVIWLSNGLAKISGAPVNVDLGFASFSLIALPAARDIADQASTGTFLSPLGAFYQGVVLPNWAVFGTFLTVAEIAAGLALLAGALTRAAALGTLALIAPIWLMYLFSAANQYAFLYPVDLVPLALLAVVPAGRTWGLDARLAARFGNRWPF